MASTREEMIEQAIRLHVGRYLGHGDLCSVKFSLRAHAHWSLEQLAKDLPQIGREFRLLLWRAA